MKFKKIGALETGAFVARTFRAPIVGRPMIITPILGFAILEAPTSGSPIIRTPVGITGSSANRYGHLHD